MSVRLTWAQANRRSLTKGVLSGEDYDGRMRSTQVRKYQGAIGVDGQGAVAFSTRLVACGGDRLWALTWQRRERLSLLACRRRKPRPGTRQAASAGIRKALNAINPGGRAASGHGGTRERVSPYQTRVYPPRSSRQKKDND